MTSTISPTPTVSPTITPTYTVTPTSTALSRLEFGYVTPNPFLPTLGQRANFNYSIATNLGAVQIRIMNIQGRLVRTLINNSEWDGRDNSGKLCEGGLYIYQIENGRQRITGTVVLISE
jgi:flagellar hook assembly protein FlgD